MTCALGPVAPHIGRLASGAHGSLADVAGVTVGHCTVADGPLQTGVTVIRPHAGDLYRDRVPAGLAVINGFGKSAGLLQLEELGVIETPVALTNTFSVPAMTQAQIRACVHANPECGRSLPTVNPLVLECNDGHLNDIQAMVLDEAHYQRALADAGKQFAQGAVGAGRGMSCFGIKGGIGSASRIVPVTSGQQWVVGALVLANFGVADNLRIDGTGFGAPLRRALQAREHESPPAPERGSIIMVLATDAPLDSRQLSRLARRSAAGLARTGSVYGHGSGDIAVAFSTAYTVPLASTPPVTSVPCLHESLLDGLFQAAADGVEQAILNALWAADTTYGRDGHVRYGLTELLGVHGVEKSA